MTQEALRKAMEQLELCCRHPHVNGSLANLNAAIAGIAALSQQADTQKLESALAECRDAFPVPAVGSDQEQLFAAAMGDPLEVPGYVVACVQAAGTEQAPPLPMPECICGFDVYTEAQLRERDAMWMAKIAALRSEQAPAITEQAPLDTLVNRVANTSFACGAFDSAADPQAYLELTTKAGRAREDLRAAIRQASEAIKTWPDRIYLQHSEDREAPNFQEVFSQRDEITWCQDRQFDGDVEYVRADLVRWYEQAPAGEVPILTTSQILALERRSNMTDDEAIRFARSVESLILSTPPAVPHQGKENAASFPKQGAELMEARKIAHEYTLPNSSVDSGNLYWALCVALSAAQPQKEQP